MVFSKIWIIKDAFKKPQQNIIIVNFEFSSLRTLEQEILATEVYCMSKFNNLNLKVHFKSVVLGEWSWIWIGNTLNLSRLIKNVQKRLFPPGLEPGTFRVLGERDNHYTTETWLEGLFYFLINYFITHLISGLHLGSSLHLII